MKNIQKMFKSQQMIFVAVALVVIAGVALLSQSNVMQPSQLGIQNIVSQGNTYPATVEILFHQEPQLTQDYQGNNVFTASVRVKNLDTSAAKFFTVSYAFHTSRHGDVTTSFRRYLNPEEASLFEFSTIGKAEIQSNETATGNFVVEEK